MFKSIITTTPFTSETANDFFQNVNGETFQRDITFLSSLRALIAPRMKEGDNLYLCFQSSNYSAAELARQSVNDAIRNTVYLDVHESGKLTIHNFTRNAQEDNYAWMEAMKASFCDVYPGWHPLEKVTLLFRKKFYVRCFVNPELKSTIIFTDNMDIRKMHYLQCAILGYLPWYFNPQDGVDDLEKELIESLRENTSQRYEDCLARMAERYDFKTEKIRRLLAGFETRYEEVECDNMRNQILQTISSIEDLNRRIGEYLKQKNEYEIRLLGLETKIAQGGGDSEIMEYFLCNDKLVLESVDHTKLVFGVKDYLTYFDEDMAKRVINNDASYVYCPRGRRCNNYILAEDMKMLMTAIFVDQILRVRVCAAYEFQLNGNVRARGSYSYGSEYRGYTPNTHIDRYNCLGNYERQINNFLVKHDYIGAIEQCVASCKSLNFGDSPVMQEFMSRLYGISDYSESVNIRCIELPNGNVVFPKEAIEYLKQEANANG